MLWETSPLPRPLLFCILDFKTSVRGIRVHKMNEDQLIILRVDSSMRQAGSVSRHLADAAMANLHASLPGAEIVLRDLKAGVGHVNSAWREASLETAGSRSSEDRAILAQSDALRAEVERARGR